MAFIYRWLIGFNVNLLVTSGVNEEKYANIKFHLLQKYVLYFLYHMS